MLEGIALIYFSTAKKVISVSSKEVHEIYRRHLVECLPVKRH